MDTLENFEAQCKHERVDAIVSRVMFQQEIRKWESISYEE